MTEVTKEEVIKYMSEEFFECFMELEDLFDELMAIEEEYLNQIHHEEKNV